MSNTRQKRETTLLAVPRRGDVNGTAVSRRRILRAVRFLLSDRLRLCQNWILLVALPIGNGAPRSDQFGFVSLGHKVTNLTAHSISLFRIIGSSRQGLSTIL